MKQQRTATMIVGALVAALAVATLILPDQVPAGVVLKGANYGSATGLLAVGLVLTYRTTRIINFSYGAMGTLGGGLAAALTRRRGGTGARPPSSAWPRVSSSAHWSSGS